MKTGTTTVSWGFIAFLIVVVLALTPEKKQEEQKPIEVLCKFELPGIKQISLKELEEKLNENKGT